MGTKREEIAESIIKDFRAAVEGVAKNPLTLTAEKEKEIKQLVDHIYKVAPNTTDHVLGEVLSRMATLNGTLTKAKKQRDAALQASH